MISFLGRMTLAVIVTAMLVFGGLLVVANDSSDACDGHGTKHVYKIERIGNTTYHYYDHHYYSLFGEDY